MIKSKCNICGEYFEHDTENYGTDKTLCPECYQTEEKVLQKPLYCECGYVSYTLKEYFIHTAKCGLKKYD